MFPPAEASSTVPTVLALKVTALTVDTATASVVEPICNWVPDEIDARSVALKTIWVLSSAPAPPIRTGWLAVLDEIDTLWLAVTEPGNSIWSPTSLMSRAAMRPGVALTVSFPVLGVFTVMLT